jgi:hypothetical protein
VKPKIVASRDFFPTCDMEATTTTILPNTLQNGFNFTEEVILGPLWQDFSKCFSNGFYRNPAKPLTKKRLSS